MTAPRTRRTLLALGFALLALLTLAVGKVMWTVDARLIPAEIEAATPQSEVLPGWTAFGSVDAVTTLLPAETEREGVEATEAEFGPNGHWLRLVESRSGLPSSDAKLRIWSPGAREAQAEFLFQRALENSELETLLAEGTESIPVDALGRARLARSNLRRWAVAERDGAWGWSLIEPNGAADVEVELVPDFSIDVRVRGQSGAGLEDVGVVVQTVEGRYYSNSEVLISARTDAAGFARIEHVGWIAAFENCSPLEPLRVGLAGLFDERIEIEIEQESPPTAPVEFIAPDGGDVELLTVDADGRALPLEFTGHLALLLCNPADEEDCEMVGEPVTACGRDGRAVFRSVPFGQRFEVWVESPQGVVLSECEYGTSSPRERQVFELPCARPTRVCGRAVNENGRPWARTLLHVSTQDEGRYEYSEGTVRTDDEGRFEFDGFWPDHLEDGFLEAEACGNEESRRDCVPVRLPPPGAGGRAQVACARELVLERVPLLVSGRVTYADGSPGRFVTIEAVLWRRDADRDGSGRPSLLVGLPFTTSDEQGRFELRSELEGELLELVATSSTARSRLLEVSVGSDGIELQLERTGTVRGRILLSPSRVASSLELELYPELNDDREGSGLLWARSTVVDRDGSFEFRDVLSGSWELTVWGEEGELAVVESIDVHPGRLTLDPRLAAIEIPSNFIVLRCIDERGWQALGLRAQVRALGNPSNEPEVLELHGNLLHIPREFLPAEVWLEGREFLALHLPSVETSGTIEFIRAPVLSLDFGTIDPETRRGFALEITSSEPPRMWPDSLECSIDDDGVARSPVPFTGRVDLRLKARVPGLHMKYAEIPVSPSFVILQCGAPPQTVQVRFDAEALRAAIAAERRAHDLFEETNER